MSLSEFGNKVLDQLEEDGFDVRSPKTIEVILKHYQCQEGIDKTVKELKTALSQGINH